MSTTSSGRFSTRSATGYTPFEGICLTDTFELYEKDDFFETEDFQQNSARVQRRRKSPIRIVIGNPPYSVGQKSANDNAQNQSYPKLEAKIAETYAKKSTANLQKGLYDSYIKAFRWATDRLEGGKGIVAFISNASWLDSNATDGFRATLQEEFDSIYVFNLRGNQRTSGELSRKEGGKIFGSGSRTPIAITLLVRNGETGFTRLTGFEGGENPVNPVNPVQNSLYHVTKMRFAKKEHPVDENKNGKLDRWELEDRSRIIYNDRITIRGIPLAAYDYVVNGKSAIEWVMERYQVTTNKDSGIVNDPNKWLEESGDERYIVDLILKVVTVSMETQKIVAKLPRLEF